MAAHVSIAPYFKVPDEKWAEFKSGFAPFYEKTRNGTMKNGQCLYYGFAIHGNTIYCREGYKDAKSVLAHLAEVKELMEKASNLVGAERLKLELLGPKQELDVLRPIFEPRGAKFYEMDQETLVNFKQTKQTKDDHVTIVPYMKVKEGQMEKYRKIIDEFYEKTRQGKANCLYYEYCTNGNTILCREGYKTGEDLLQHFADVAQPYQKAKNLAEFDISIVGPKSELDKIRKDPNVDPVKFYELDEGAIIAIE